MTDPLLAPDDKSAHTSKGSILIVMFHVGVYRKNEDEPKEWTCFLLQKNVKYFSVDCIISDIHEIESKKPQCTTFKSS